MSLITYFQETRAELKHINWPTRRQAILYTIAVLLISGIVAYFLGFFDFLFTSGLTKLLER